MGQPKGLTRLTFGEKMASDILNPISHEILYGEQHGPIVTVVDQFKPWTYEALRHPLPIGTIVDCGTVVHENDGADALLECGESRVRGRVLGPATLVEVSESHSRSNKRNIPLIDRRVWMKVAYD